MLNISRSVKPSFSPPTKKRPSVAGPEALLDDFISAEIDALFTRNDLLCLLCLLCLLYLLDPRDPDACQNEDAPPQP